MMDNSSIDAMLDELAVAAKLEQTECGELWRALILSKTAAKYGSKDFRAAWENEVMDEYQNFKKNFRIVEVTETKEVTYKDLEFIG